MYQCRICHQRILIRFLKEGKFGLFYHFYGPGGSIRCGPVEKIPEHPKEDIVMIDDVEFTGGAEILLKE